MVLPVTVISISVEDLPNSAVIFPLSATAPDENDTFASPFSFVISLNA